MELNYNDFENKPNNINDESNEVIEAKVVGDTLEDEDVWEKKEDNSKTNEETKSHSPESSKSELDVMSSLIAEDDNILTEFKLEQTRLSNELAKLQDKIYEQELVSSVRKSANTEVKRMKELFSSTLQKFCSILPPDVVEGLGYEFLEEAKSIVRNHSYYAQNKSVLNSAKETKEKKEEAVKQILPEKEKDYKDLEIVYQANLFIPSGNVEDYSDEHIFTQEELQAIIEAIKDEEVLESLKSAYSVPANIHKAETISKRILPKVDVALSFKIKLESCIRKINVDRELNQRLIIANGNNKNGKF